jgi:uncharacterized protein (DUF2126 family)
MEPDPLLQIAARNEARFAANGVSLTLGGEPTFVPFDPVGPEWNVTALGPTKLSYAYALAQALRNQVLPFAMDFHSPGKSYPGEVNPRWAVVLLWNRDRSSLTSCSVDQTSELALSDEAIGKFRGVSRG